MSAGVWGSRSVKYGWEGGCNAACPLCAPAWHYAAGKHSAGGPHRWERAEQARGVNHDVTSLFSVARVRLAAGVGG